MAMFVVKSVVIQINGRGNGSMNWSYQSIVINCVHSSAHIGLYDEFLKLR